MSRTFSSPRDRRVYFRAEDCARRCIDRVMDLSEGVAETIFIEFDAARVMDYARGADEAAHTFHRSLPLHGLVISLKDIIDERGLVTSAGSAFLQNRASACEDATVVSRLRAAGAVPFGRSNMSELAYTGLGLNPHFGTPNNATDVERIPGGSSSGAAVSVALGLCDAAIASDTGGSVRIPAALNGVYGFKPTRAAIPSKGIFSLCPTFDSVGPLARSMALCGQIHSVLSGQCPAPQRIKSLDGLHIGLLVSPMTDGLDTQVSDDLDKALAALREAGAIIAPVAEPSLIHCAEALGTLCSFETMGLISGYLEGLKQTADPYVMERILACAEVEPKAVEEARSQRVAAIRAFKEMARKFDALIAPTVPIVAPLLADVQADPRKFGPQLSQNTRAVNWVDGCAANIPMHAPGMPGSGLMVFGATGTDCHVLEMAQLIDKVVTPARLKGN